MCGKRTGVDLGLHLAIGDVKKEWALLARAESLVCENAKTISFALSKSLFCVCCSRVTSPTEMCTLWLSFSLFS